jgi:PAS domain S-box-containing protein
MKKCDKSMQKIIFSYLTDRNPNFKKISEKILKEIKKETKSKYGFVGYIDKKNNYLIIPTFTGNNLKECKIKKFDVIFKNLNTLYGKAIRTKKIVLSQNIGKDRMSTIPAGHVKIENFIAVPALIKKEAIGILALANKALPFSKDDIKYLKNMADFYAKIIYQLIHIKGMEEEYSFLKNIVENSRDIIYLVNKDGKIEYMNKKYLDYGYKREDIIGHKVSEFSHKEDLNFVMSAFKNTMKTGKTLNLLQYRVLKKDGTFFYADQKSSVLFKNKKPEKIIGNIRDVTNERKLEMELRHQKEILNKIYNSATDMIYIKNLDGKYITVNNACLKFLRKTENEVIGKTDLEIFGKELYEKIKKDENEVLRGKSITNNIYDFPYNNKISTISIVRSPIKDECGNVKYILSIARDITKIKKMEEKITLIKTKEKFEKLISELAHDINNTLSIISGHTTLIAQEIDKKDMSKMSIDQINKSIKRTISLIKEFRKKSDIKKID